MKLNESLIINKALDDLDFDCKVSECLRHKRVLESVWNQLSSQAKSYYKEHPIRTKIAATYLTIQAIDLIASAIYKLYVKRSFSKCSKLINGQARSECINQLKIKALEKTIDRLKSIRTKDNAKKIDIKIAKLKMKIKKIQKKLLNVGWEF
jgi:hypothetical protein